MGPLRQLLSQYPRLPSILFLVACIAIAFYSKAWIERRQHDEQMRWWKDSSFAGRVVERAIDHANHNFKEVVLDENGSSIEFSYPEIYAAVMVGDSLLKKSGDLDAAIKSPDGSSQTFRLFSQEEE